MEKVTVLTVSYNCKDDLLRTIESVVAQTYDNIEYIIVDGGSKDGTQDVLKSYASHIDKCVSEPDDGIYDAMNKGIRMATGEWIICMNAGDVFASSDTLQRALADDIPQTTDFLYSDYIVRYADGHDELRQCDRQRGVVHHQNAIYRRRLHEEFGYYIVTHPYIVSDLMFFLAVPADRFKKLPEPISAIAFGGASGGYWCSKQAWCLRYIYGLDSLPRIFLRLLKLEIGAALRKLHLRK